jgi:hypothetical protein
MFKMAVLAASTVMVTATVSSCSSNGADTETATGVDKETEPCAEWSPIAEQPEETPMPAGCYGLDAATESRAELPAAVVQVPADWVRSGTWFVLRGTDRSVDGHFRGVAYLAPLTVYTDPCHNDGKPTGLHVEAELDLRLVRRLRHGPGVLQRMLGSPSRLARSTGAHVTPCSGI